MKQYGKIVKHVIEYVTCIHIYNFLNEGQICINEQSQLTLEPCRCWTMMKRSIWPCSCVHWDGMLLPDLIGKEKVDRLPALITRRENKPYRNT